MNCFILCSLNFNLLYVLNSIMSESIQQIPATLKEYNRWSLFYIVLFSNLGTLLFGYEIGATTWVIYIIQQYSSYSTDDPSIYYYQYVAETSSLIGLIAAGAALGAVIFYPILLIYAHSWSKKDEILLAAGFYFVGGLLQSLSSSISWSDCWGLVLLILGRFVYGAAIATTLHSIPQYISEVTPVGIRGQYGASVEVMVMTGMTFGFAFGYFFDFKNLSWVMTFRIAYILSILMGIFTLYLPDNPVWMLHYEYNPTEVLKALQVVYPKASLEDIDYLKQQMQYEYDQKIKIENQLNKYKDLNERHWFFRSSVGVCVPHTVQLIIFDPLYRRCVSVQLLFNLFKILTGQTVILYYASTFFSDLYNEKIEDYVFMYILSRTCMAYIMLGVVEYWGRREFLLLSASLMTITLFLNAITYLLHWDTIVTIGLFIAGLGFQIGYGSISYFLVNEIVPFSIRSTSNALTNFSLFLFYCLMTFLFPIVLDSYGFQFIFFFFAVTNAMGYYFIYYYIPETRGLSLETSYRRVDEMFTRAPRLCPCCQTDQKINSENALHPSEAQSLLSSVND